MSEAFLTISKEYESLKTVIFHEQNNGLSKMPIYIFLFCFVSCMAFSTIMHLFLGMSETVTNVLMRLDYAGICFLIFGSCVPPYYYAFMCTPIFAYAYLSVAFVGCLIAFVISMFPYIHLKRNTSKKGLMFAILGLSVALPSLHLVAQR
jgi:adiponectin receptor